MNQNNLNFSTQRLMNSSVLIEAIDREIELSNNNSQENQDLIKIFTSEMRFLDKISRQITEIANGSETSIDESTCKWINEENLNKKVSQSDFQFDEGDDLTRNKILKKLTQILERRTTNASTFIKKIEHLRKSSNLELDSSDPDQRRERLQSDIVPTSQDNTLNNNNKPFHSTRDTKDTGKFYVHQANEVMQQPPIVVNTTRTFLDTSNTPNIMWSQKD